MRPYLIAIAALTALAGALPAAAPDPALVSADAKWVAHLDVDALLATQIGQYAATELDKHQPNAFNPNDLRSVTIWGEQYSPDAGIAVIVGSANREELLDLAQQNPGYQRADFGAYTLHRWTQTPEGPLDSGIRWGTFFREGMILAGRHRAILESAITTLDDGTATMAAQESPLLGATFSPGTFLVLVGEGFPQPPTDSEHATILRNIVGAYAELGELDGMVSLDVWLTSTDQAASGQVQAVLQGILAFAMMRLEGIAEQGGAEPHWAPLARAARITGEGPRTRITVQMPAAEVIAHITRNRAEQGSNADTATP